MALFSTSGKSFRERKLRYVLKNYLKLNPKNLDLYFSAVVHTSYKGYGDERGTYDRLEFLGDALFGAYITAWIFKKYPQKNEGELSKLKSKLCSRKFLNKLAFKLHINHLIYFSTRENLSENSIPGNTLEALFGAVYLDQGLNELHKLFDHIIKHHINVSEVEKQDMDYKSRVIQFCQKHKKKHRFVTTSMDHRNGRDYFTIALEIEGFDSVEAEGFSKKKAEQQACKVFYESKKQEFEED